MTTGQRVAAKRKELELSQEGLGEALGVSRQSIYKWERDASLPEIDKLVAMSRLFQVTVGWLLGVEQTPESPDGAALSPDQLRLVEEILSRCQQSEPSRLSQEQLAQVEELMAERVRQKPKSLWDKWSVPILFAMCGAIVASVLSINAKVDRSEQQYNNLANSIGNVTYSVNSQIGSITSRVEEILKSQNSLTADYDTQLLHADLAQNTVTFSLRVVPKTYVEGMEVVFLADSGDGPVEFPAQLGPDRAFTGEVTCPLTDGITLSAVFLSADTRQTQLLDSYGGLYGQTMPYGEIRFLEPALLHTPPARDGSFQLPQAGGGVYFTSRADSAPGSIENLDQAAIQSVRLGLFQNQRLVRWLEPCEASELISVPDPTDQEASWFSMPATSLSAKEGDWLCFAALVTDQYGREQMILSVPSFLVQDGEITWGGRDDYAPFSPEEWEF